MACCCGTGELGFTDLTGRPSVSCFRCWAKQASGFVVGADGGTASYGLNLVGHRPLVLPLGKTGERVRSWKDGRTWFYKLNRPSASCFRRWQNRRSGSWLEPTMQVHLTDSTWSSFGFLFSPLGKNRRAGSWLGPTGELGFTALTWSAVGLLFSPLAQTGKLAVGGASASFRVKLLGRHPAFLIRISPLVPVYKALFSCCCPYSML